VFVGHYALSLAAKRAAPRTSLGTLIAAATFADLLWPLLVGLGLERVLITPSPDPFLRLTFTSYPWSHSLLALGCWGLLFGALYRLRTGYRTGALVVGGLVVSHWVLDWLVHRPDLPLYPGGGPRLGLGVWADPAATVVIEAAMLVGGLWIYLHETKALDGVGRVAFWALILVISASYGASLVAGPPPGTRSIAIGGTVFGWLFVAWAAWADRHRAPRREARETARP